MHKLIAFKSKLLLLTKIFIRLIVVLNTFDKYTSIHFKFKNTSQKKNVIPTRISKQLSSTTI